jgi:hypothetical protein
MFIMRNTLRNLDGIIERKEITPAERVGIVRIAQGIMATVF